jgi:enoyl-CoA hydratase
LMGMRRSLKIMLTGESMTGKEAAETGWANQVFPDEGLEVAVLDIAQRIAKIPSDLLAFNKRSVHRAMEAMGMRNALRAGTDLQAASFHTSSSRNFMKKFAGKGSLKNVFALLRDNNISTNYRVSTAHDDAENLEQVGHTRNTMTSKL